MTAYDMHPELWSKVRHVTTCTPIHWGPIDAKGDPELFEVIQDQDTAPCDQCRQETPLPPWPTLVNVFGSLLCSRCESGGDLGWNQLREEADDEHRRALHGDDNDDA